MLPFSFELSDDGLSLQIKRQDGHNTWYDVRTGSKLVEIQKKSTKESPGYEQELESLTRGTRYTVTTTLCQNNPDDLQFVIPYREIRCMLSDQRSLILWEATDRDEAITRPISFTPDDRSLLTRFANEVGGVPFLCLLESRTGKERYRFGVPTDGRGR